MSEKWDRRFLTLAEHIGSWSKDPSTKVGAVIVKDKRVISVGFNGFAKGVNDAEARYVDREAKYHIILHAERNALLFAKQDLTGCTIYTTPFMPCAACAAMIIQVGIERVVSYKQNLTSTRWAEEFRQAMDMFAEVRLRLDLIARELP